MSSPPTPPRFVPDEPLPPYAYVTGRFPHPTADPAGHSFGLPHGPVVAPDPDRWGECRDYLVGVDRFNHGYYWEAHETWEGLWRACERRGPTATFLQGLIRLAAAGFKARQGNSTGVRSHACAARERFEAVGRSLGPGRYLGLDLTALMAFAADLADCPEQAPTGGDTPVPVVFRFRLLPAADPVNPSAG
jgi:uncharacterized protein